MHERLLRRLVDSISSALKSDVLTIISIKLPLKEVGQEATFKGHPESGRSATPLLLYVKAMRKSREPGLLCSKGTISQQRTAVAVNQ